jgi:hypothetical protein
MLVAIGMTGVRINDFVWTLTVLSFLQSSCWPWVSFYPHASESQWVAFPASVELSDVGGGRNLRPPRHLNRVSPGYGSQCAAAVPFLKSK